MTLREAAQQAIEAMELHVNSYPHMDKGYMVDAREALQKALAQPESEPSDRELQRHNDYVAGFDEATKRAQQVAVPPTHPQLAQGAFIPQVTGFAAPQPQEQVAVPQMREVVAVAVTMLYETHPRDVMEKFSIDDLSEISKITDRLGNAQVEDVYRAMWDLLKAALCASLAQSNKL